MIPRFLYHGTTTSNIPSIKNNGLLPRSMAKVEGLGNWENCPSNENAVYLTSAFAHYYAAQASQEGAEDLLILRIDTEKLDQNLFCADEDAVEQVLRGRDDLKNLSVQERTLFYREKIFDYAAMASLEVLGNCCYFGPIPRKAIHDAVRISFQDYIRLVMNGYDPSITVGCYRFLKNKYENLCKATFSGWNKELPFNKQTHKEIFKKAKLS